MKCALPFIPLVPEVAVIRSGNCWRLRGSRLLPPRIIIFLFLPFFFLFKIVKICFFYFLYFLNRKTGRDWRTNIRCSTIHNCLLLARAAPHFRDENSLQRFLLFQQFSFKLVLISNIKESPLGVVLSVPLLKNTNISPAARELFTNNFLSTTPLIHHLHSASVCYTTVW